MDWGVVVNFVYEVHRRSSHLDESGRDGVTDEEIGENDRKEGFPLHEVVLRGSEGEIGRRERLP